VITRVGDYEVLTHEALEGLPVCHGFTTRRGPAGRALSQSDDFDRLAYAAGFAELRTLAQEHGTRVVRAELSPTGTLADAVVTDRPGLLVGVVTADCVPILLHDPRAPAVAAVHAGWRGSASAIARAAVQSLTEAYGSRPRDLTAVIGPAIGPCCYEVGPEVLEALERAHPGAGKAAGQGANGRNTVDLWQANRMILEGAGVAPERIHVLRACTSCRADLFPSFRRDGAGCGRLLAFIGLLR
jgi:YfiH family protein